MAVKLIASDMDGTLLDENGQVPPETFDLILALREHGVRFVASSGRRYDRLCDFFSPVKDRMDFVASNGAQVFADGVQIDREVYSCLLYTSAGDMLEIRSTPGPDAPADVPKRWPIVPCPRDVASGEEVLIPCKRKVEAGSAVHVVRSAGTILEAEAAVREMREEEVRLAAAESGGVAPEACLEASEAGAGREGIAVSELGVDCASAEPARFAHARRRRENGAVVEPGAGGACAVEPSAGCACKSPHTAVDLGEVCRLEDLEGVRAACERVVRGEAPAVVVRNIGQIPTVRAAGVPWEVGSPLQVWNAETARVLVRLGARRVWLPEELTMEDLSLIHISVSPRDTSRAGTLPPAATS